MKKIVLIIGIAFLSSSCSKKLYNVEKAVTVPVIDGDQTEWPVNTIRSNNNINYAIQQDQDNLYLMVSSFDEQIMKKIMLLVRYFLKIFNLKIKKFEPLILTPF